MSFALDRLEGKLLLKPADGFDSMHLPAYLLDYKLLAESANHCLKPHLCKDDSSVFSPSVRVGLGCRRPTLLLYLASSLF